ARATSLWLPLASWVVSRLQRQGELWSAVPMGVPPTKKRTLLTAAVDATSASHAPPESVPDTVALASGALNDTTGAACAAPHTASAAMAIGNLRTVMEISLACYCTAARSVSAPYLLPVGSFSMIGERTSTLRLES